MYKELAKAVEEMAANKKIGVKVLASMALDYCEHLESPEIIEQQRRLSVLNEKVKQC